MYVAAAAPLAAGLGRQRGRVVRVHSDGSYDVELEESDELAERLTLSMLYRTKEDD